jgi:hypothetical protein
VHPKADDLPAPLNQRIGGDPMQYSSFDGELFNRRGQGLPYGRGLGGAAEPEIMS